jgi:hypothetical protein
MVLIDLIYHRVASIVNEKMVLAKGGYPQDQKPLSAGK